MLLMVCREAVCTGTKLKHINYFNIAYRIPYFFACRKMQVLDSYNKDVITTSAQNCVSTFLSVTSRRYFEQQSVAPGCYDCDECALLPVFHPLVMESFVAESNEMII